MGDIGGNVSAVLPAPLSESRQDGHILPKSYESMLALIFGHARHADTVGGG
jgi:hypothetical protein